MSRWFCPVNTLHFLQLSACIILNTSVLYLVKEFSLKKDTDSEFGVLNLAIIPVSFTQDTTLKSRQQMF